MYRFIVVALIAVVSNLGFAAEYAKISEKDWQEAKRKITQDRTVIDPDTTSVRVEFVENRVITAYHFTNELEKSHPAMIKVEAWKTKEGLKFRSQGWFAGNEEKFKAWMKQIVKTPMATLEKVNRLDMYSGVVIEVEKPNSKAKPQPKTN